jgi:hypothetical protein
MLELKNGANITESEIGLIISNFLVKIIEENIPHKWIAMEEPFANIYNGRISYDYSGEVQKTSVIDLKRLSNITSLILYMFLNLTCCCQKYILTAGCRHMNQIEGKTGLVTKIYYMINTMIGNMKVSNYATKIMMTQMKN